MEKDSLIKLTNNLYQVTLFFPKKEPLRYKIREVADNILSNFSAKNLKKYRDEALSNLEILDSFLGVALNQKWVSPSDILAIKKEYSDLKEELESQNMENMENIEKNTALSPNFEKSVVASFADESNSPEKNENQTMVRRNSERQDTIIQFIKENGPVQVWQIKKVMPDVSKRTLRRDFEYMFKSGLIERIGEKNETYYKIKNT